MKTRPVFVAGGMRIPFVKSRTDYQAFTTNQLMVAALQALVTKMQLDGKVVGDVALGAVMNSSLNWALARECVLNTTLDPHTPAYFVQRACGTGLDATLQIVLKIANKQIEYGIAGGVDTNSDLPVVFKRAFAQKILYAAAARGLWGKLKAFTRFRPSDFLPQFPAVEEAQTHLSMGQHCELMVKEWQIPRVAQDELALQSHINGVKAYEEGFYQDLVTEFAGIQRDKILRADTTLEKLAKLKPAFDFTGKGTLTAGNSSPLSDGASAVLLTSEDMAAKLNLALLARFVDAEAAAVDFVHGEGLLMAPTIAVSQLLERNKLSLQDFDFYEIHEAFAGQVLCTLKAWESPDYCQRVLKRSAALGSIDRSKLNVKGSSIALGHPFAATGARIVAGLAKLLHQKPKSRGLISICTAGGMGVAAILES